MKEAVIVSAVRTALGSLGGALSSVPACTLESAAISEAVRRAGIAIGDVDEFFIENVLGCRHNEDLSARLRLELKVQDATGIVITGEPSGCGLMLGALGVATERVETVVVGGAENPSRTDTRGYWILDAYGELAELVAEKHNVRQTERDQFITRSRQNTLKAIGEGAFKEEIVPVKINHELGEPGMFDSDEIPGKLGASAVPGEAKFSRIAVGAAALVIMTKEKAESLGIKPICKIVACCTAGQRPCHIVMAPLLAIPSALKQASLEPDEINIYEIDEVFPASSVAIIKELGINPETVNVRGGSLSLGYPFGASAARMMATLLHAMTDMDTETGMLSMSLGAEDALSMVVARP